MCQTLLDQVAQIAAQNHGCQVETIEVHWGPLSGVEIELLQRAFEFARVGTPAASAILSIQKLPVRVMCSQCLRESEVSVNKLVCRHCGNWRTRLVGGDELLLSQVVLDKPETMVV